MRQKYHPGDYQAATVLNNQQHPYVLSSLHLWLGLVLYFTDVPCLSQMSSHQSRSQAKKFYRKCFFAAKPNQTLVVHPPKPLLNWASPKALLSTSNNLP
jgi:hypothetical protein